MTSQTPTRELRVREKLVTCGAHNLSDAELLSLFISSRDGKKSCAQLALDVIQHLGDVRAIINADLQTFLQAPGLDVVQFVRLQAARELCRRSDFISLQKDIQLTNSQETYTYLKRKLRDKKNETFVALFLDSQHHILSYEELFTGTINTATVHPRPIIQRILKLNASAVILAHNHPSGLSDASSHDIAVTVRLRQALALVDAKLLDHLVIGDNEVYSITNKIKWPCH